MREIKNISKLKQIPSLCLQEMTSIQSLTEERRGGRRNISEKNRNIPELDLAPDLESPEEGKESAVVPGRHVGVDHRGQAQAGDDDAQAGDELGDADWGWHDGGGNTGGHHTVEAGSLRWWQGLLSSSSPSLTLNVLRNI